MADTFTLPTLLDHQDAFVNGPHLDEPSFDESLEEVSLEDIDRAIYNHINDNLNIHVIQDGRMMKVPVIFAAGERWALVRDKRAFRDKHGALILPLISIRRLDEDRSQAAALPIASIPATQLVFKIKRSPRNKYFQNAKNIINLINQDKVGKNVGLVSETPSSKTSRRQSAKPFSGTTFRGRQIEIKNKQEIVDIFSIPYPDFFKVNYEITFWSQYQEEMNSMTERYNNAFETFSIDTFKIDTDSGYYFIGYGESTITNDSNVDEFTDQERIIRRTHVIEMPVYTIQAQPGEEHLVRKYTSAPQIAFIINAIDDDITDESTLERGNPHERFGKLTEIEDLTQNISQRPRVQRAEHRHITKKIKKKYVGETTAFFPNIEELDRFFK